jgi:hypothetical protein
MACCPFHKFHMRQTHIPRVMDDLSVLDHDQDRIAVSHFDLLGQWRRKIGKKSARELRQEGSNYRCCIPALAGFVSPQSIAPDGDKQFAARSTSCNRVLSSAAFVDSARRFWLHRSLRWIALLGLVLLQCGCNTLANRRDLYTPPADPFQVSEGAVRVSRAAPAPPAAGPRPEFR